jgi:hypothetical protein
MNSSRPKDDECYEAERENELHKPLYIKKLTIIGNKQRNRANSVFEEETTQLNDVKTQY